MAYKHGEYILHRKEVTLKSNKKKYALYFFAKKISSKGTPCDLPNGYKVIENKISGCPFLKFSDKISNWESKYKYRLKKSR